MTNAAQEIRLNLFPVLKPECSDYFAKYQGQYIDCNPASYNFGNGEILQIPTAALKLNKTMSLLAVTGSIGLLTHGVISIYDTVSKVIFQKIYYLDDGEIKSIELPEFGVQKIQTTNPNNHECLITTEWGDIRTSLNPETGGFEAVTDAPGLIGIMLLAQRTNTNKYSY